MEERHQNPSRASHQWRSPSAGTYGPSPQSHLQRTLHTCFASIKGTGKAGEHHSTHFEGALLRLFFNGKSSVQGTVILQDFEAELRKYLAVERAVAEIAPAHRAGTLLRADTAPLRASLRAEAAAWKAAFAKNLHRKGADDLHVSGLCPCFYVPGMWTSTYQASAHCGNSHVFVAQFCNAFSLRMCTRTWSAVRKRTGLCAFCGDIDRSAGEYMTLLSSERRAQATSPSSLKRCSSTAASRYHGLVSDRCLGLHSL